jgi:hypothetical protein
MIYLIGIITWTVLIWYITRHETKREIEIFLREYNNDKL